MTSKHDISLASFLVAAPLVLAACGGAAPVAPTSAPTLPLAATAAATGAAITAATEAATAATKAPAATAAVTATTAAGGAKQITIGWYQEPSAVTALYSSQAVVALLGELTNVALWNYDDNDKVVLELAKVYPTVENGGVSADGKTITYTLKDGLKWSDGQPLTSADIKFTWQAIMNPDNKGVYSRFGYDQIASIDTPNDTTAIVKLKDVFAPWSSTYFVQTGVAGNGLLPQHVLKDMKTLDASDFVLKSPITTGPYKITNVVKGDRIELEATDTYWRGKPKIDKIFIKIVPDRDSVLAGLRAGDLDVGDGLIEASIPDLQTTDSLKIYTKETSRFEHYFFNLGTKNYGVEGPCPFQDVNVRQAFIYAIDRQTIADKLLLGKTHVTATLWPNSPFEDTSIQPYPFNPDKAKSLLDAAGYKPGADGIRTGTCDGKPVKLSFKHMTTSSDALRQNVQTLVQQNLKDVGIEFIPDNKPSDTLFGLYNDNGPLATGNYEMGGYTTSFINAGDPDPIDNFKLSGIPTKDNPNGNNWYRLEDAQLDKLSQDQAKLPDLAKRTEIIKQMEKIIYDKAYVIPMYAYLNVDAANKRIDGIKPSVTGAIFWNVGEWDAR